VKRRSARPRVALPPPTRVPRQFCTSVGFCGAREHREATRARLTWLAAEQVSVEDKAVIARTGKWALYSALKQCCPSTIRSDDPFIGRHGLTEIEFNKVLERNGFNKIRDRSGANPSIMEGREETDEDDGKGCKGVRRGASCSSGGRVCRHAHHRALRAPAC